jgi:hypothetical protein
MEDRLNSRQPSPSRAVAVSGVEVGSFADRTAERGPRRAEDLHVCPGCASELVLPIDWAPASKDHWRVALRCPDCEWTGGGTYSQTVVDRFDEVLDLATEALLNDLTLLTRANMEEEVDRFVAALQGGHVIPADF